MISTLYYLRSVDYSKTKDGEIITVNIFFDEKVNVFKFRFVGRETIKTKFGKVKTIIFKPMVQSGRVFKDKENVSFWVTDDKNKIPIKIKASILVGAINAELIEYKGLSNSFPIIFD